MKALWLMALLGAVACTGGDGNGNDTDPNDPDDGTDGDTNTEDPQIDTSTEPADREFTANLSEGQIISDLDWADSSDVDFCWPGNQNDQFTGNHVFFEVEKNGNDYFIFRATPDPGVNLSIYVLEFSGDYQYPPNVTSASRCEASAEAGSGAAEQPEGAMAGWPDKRFLVGVAGADGATSGGFKLEIWEALTDGFDTD